jgi:hypothetical protein
MTHSGRLWRARRCCPVCEPRRLAAHAFVIRGCGDGRCARRRLAWKRSGGKSCADHGEINPKHAQEIAQLNVSLWRPTDLAGSAHGARRNSAMRKMPDRRPFLQRRLSAQCGADTGLGLHSTRRYYSEDSMIGSSKRLKLGGYESKNIVNARLNGSCSL